MSVLLKKYSTIYLFGLLVLVMSGCGYTLVGQGSLPGHIKTMAIPTFENLTLEHGVEDVLTQAMIDAYVRGGKVQLVVESTADAVLSGTIRAYSANEAVEFNERNDPITYRLTVTVDIELRDPIADASLWKADNMQGSADFSGGPDFNLADESENKRAALMELAQELARKVFALSTEGF